MSALRKLFYSLSLRESILLAITLWALLLLWFFSLMDSANVRIREYSLNREVLDTFAQTLALEKDAQMMLDSARAGLDQNQTFSAAQLGGMVDSIARQTNLASFDIRTPSTVRTDLFSFHNVRVRIQKARLEDLIRFDQIVKSYAPYIALADFRLSANKRDPRLLDADFELVSFELKEEALND